MNTRPRILLTGASGQLGSRFRALHERGVMLRGYDLVALSREQLDLSDARSIAAALASHEPDVVVNTAAYTAVDLAETQRPQAFAVNADAVGVLAEACGQQGARLVHISTDFVFGAGHGRPISRVTTPMPLNVYGESKLRGEELAQARLEQGLSILRTSWLYGSGGRNFMTTMLRLMGERDEVRVVSDQIAAPTAVTTLCAAIDAVIRRKASGLFHICDAGVASWYDFACSIEELAQDSGRLDSAANVVPIPSIAFPQAAARPSFSLLESASSFAELNLSQRHWREALRDELAVDS